MAEEKKADEMEEEAAALPVARESREMISRKQLLLFLSVTSSIVCVPNHFRARILTVEERR